MEQVQSLKRIPLLGCDRPVVQAGCGGREAASKISCLEAAQQPSCNHTGKEPPQGEGAGSQVYSREATSAVAKAL